MAAKKKQSRLRPLKDRSIKVTNTFRFTSDEQKKWLEFVATLGISEDDETALRKSYERVVGCIEQALDQYHSDSEIDDPPRKSEQKNEIRALANIVGVLLANATTLEESIAKISMPARLLIVDSAQKRRVELQSEIPSEVHALMRQLDSKYEEQNAASSADSADIYILRDQVRLWRGHLLLFERYLSIALKQLPSADRGRAQDEKFLNLLFRLSITWFSVFLNEKGVTKSGDIYQGPMIGFVAGVLRKAGIRFSRATLGRTLYEKVQDEALSRATAERAR